jgi:hypothetical protein
MTLLVFNEDVRVLDQLMNNLDSLRGLEIHRHTDVIHHQRYSLSKGDSDPTSSYSG